MKKIGLFILTLGLIVSALVIYPLFAQTIQTRSLSFRFSDDTETSSNALANLQYGQTFMFDTSNQGSFTPVFLSTNNYYLNQSLHQAYQMTSKQDIDIFYASSDTYVILLVSPSGYIYDVQYIPKAEGSNYVQFVPEIFDVIPGKTLASGTYFYTKSGVSVFAPVTAHTVYYATYVDISSNDVSVTSTNVTITNLNRETGNIQFNDTLQIVSNALDGTDVFLYVKNSDDEIVSYETSFKYTATYDTVLTAVYGDTALNQTPFVYMSPQIDLVNERVAFSAQLFPQLSDAVSLVEYGFVYGTTSTLDLSLGTTVMSRNHQKTAYHAFAKSFANASFYVKAYMITSETIDGVETFTTTYSVTRQVTLKIVETFETLALGSVSTTPSTGTYEGVVSWSYVNAFKRTLINEAMMLQAQGAGYLLSPVLPSSIRSLTLTFTNRDGGGAAGFKLYQVTSSGDIELYESSLVTGETTVTITFSALTQFKIVSRGNNQVIIDNITWRY